MMENLHWNTDERKFNRRGGPSLYHNVRVIVGKKENPLAHGVTIPNEIASKFSGCQLRIYVSGTTIIMESGCRI